eukprot:815743-Pyramimonas_sp.AAC.1
MPAFLTPCGWRGEWYCDKWGASQGGGPGGLPAPGPRTFPFRWAPQRRARPQAPESTQHPARLTHRLANLPKHRPKASGLQ